MPAPSYHNVQLDPEISMGAVYGPSYSTLVIETASGSEQRVAQWSMGRYKGSINKNALQIPQTNILVAFFHARMGKTFGFRFKDWNDYTVTNEPLAPTGAATVQLIKTYSNGGINYVRPIYAPVLSPAVTLRKNAGAFAGFTLDTVTGLVTLNALNTKAITAISAPGATTTLTVGAANGFAVNDLVQVTGVVGETQLNGLVGAVTAAPGTTITLALNSTGFSTYVSGGTATKYLTTTDTLDWSGTFDNVVRFDTDSMELTYEDVGYRSWSGIPILELR